MDFHLTAEQQRLQHKCRELAADFASRSAAHDRDASHPIENYERLREEGFLALSVSKEWGGAGASFLDHTSERKTAALSGSQHPSSIRESLRVARIPSTSQFGSTLRPSARRGSIRMIPAEGFVAPSG